MPMKLNVTLASDNAEARIEIIPLIDIMFFLLAAFMLVSLSMVNLKTVKVNLPTAVSAASDLKRDFVDISVARTGGVFLDKKPIAGNELSRMLAADLKANPNLRVLISGDRDGRYGQVIHVLDLVRAAGIDRVAFEINPTNSPAEP
jgi:biopolymer transport protein ExbD